MSFSSFRNWIINHDDNRSFIIVYITLAVTLSIALGLFWLCAVVGIHFLFELLRLYFKGEPPGRTIKTALWEVKLDIFLVLFAFVIAVYMDLIFGAAGLSAGARAAAGAGARFAGWQRVIRGIIISVDDFALALRAMGRKLSGRKAVTENVTPADPELKKDAGDDRASQDTAGGTLTKGDILSLSFGSICVLLLIASPFLTAFSAAEVFQLIVRELHPFP